MPIKIGSREIGDDHPCFITFEAGPAHDGLESANRIVKLATGEGLCLKRFSTSPGFPTFRVLCLSVSNLKGPALPPSRFPLTPYPLAPSLHDFGLKFAKVFPKQLSR